MCTAIHWPAFLRPCSTTLSSRDMRLICVLCDTSLEQLTAGGLLDCLAADDEATAMLMATFNTEWREVVLRPELPAEMLPPLLLAVAEWSVAEWLKPCPDGAVLAEHTRSPLDFLLISRWALDLEGERVGFQLTCELWLARSMFWPVEIGTGCMEERLLLGGIVLVKEGW